MDSVDDIKRLLTSKFESDLFDASLASLNEKGNKLRYNNFAYSIRELSRHFLLRLAPDANIKNCPWYTKVTDDGKPTRTQRIKYAIQGGIMDHFLDKWGFDVDELSDTIKEIKTVIDSLSKYTHINPDIFDLSDDDVDQFSKEVLSSFNMFVQMIENYREQLKRELDGHIENHMITSVVASFFQNVDRLAPHHSLDYSFISEYQISEINDQEIIVDVFGDLHVTLEYGSRQERREGDGLDLKESFPFETKIRYTIDESFPPADYVVDDFDVDTSAWYGEEDIDDKIDEHINGSE